jgi:hypothetical protein
MARVLIAEARFLRAFERHAARRRARRSRSRRAQPRDADRPGALELPGAIALAADSGRFAPSSRSAS